MIEIVIYKTEHGVEPFSDFLNEIRDARAKVHVVKSVRKIEKGLFGSSSKSLGGGLQEYKVNEGGGFRIYYYNEGQKIVVLLAGSSKKDQKRSIVSSREYLKDYKRQTSERKKGG